MAGTLREIAVATIVTSFAFRRLALLAGFIVGAVLARPDLVFAMGVLL